MGTGAGAARVAVAVVVPRSEVELVADELFALGASAVSETATPSTDAAVGATGADMATLVADLTPGSAATLAATRDVRVLEPDPLWEDGWREHARSWRCGRHLLVRPPWVPAEPLGPGDVEVLVDPGDAFGSGSHPTTRLCLTAVESRARAGARVLDVGCGSGVLGVASALLGAAAVEAIDVDPEAVRATGTVASDNGVAHLVTASATPLGEVAGRFDLVLANLLIPIVEELGAELVAHVAPGGTLVVSGVLADQRDRAVHAVAPMQVAEELREGDWLALVLERESKV